MYLDQSKASRQARKLFLDCIFFLFHLIYSIISFGCFQKTYQPNLKKKKKKSVSII